MNLLTPVSEYYDIFSTIKDSNGTIKDVIFAVIAPVSTVFAPWPTRQKYELDGVRSTADEMLLSRLG